MDQLGFWLIGMPLIALLWIVVIGAGYFIIQLIRGRI